MNPPTFLLIIFPISNIFLTNVSPVHSSHSWFHVFFPLSFKVISRWIVVHLSVAMFHIIFEITFENTSTLEDYFPFALFFTLNPISFISSVIYNIFSDPMSQTIFYLTFIAAAIRPFVWTFTCNAIISELTRINNSICPCEGSLPAQKSIKKVAFVGIAIFEGNFAVSIETFSIDFAILWWGGYFAFPIFVQYFGEFDG